jgi:hypothetical protein
MKRKQKPLRRDLLRKSNETILIIAGFILLAGLLLACLISHRPVPADQNKQTKQSDLNRE